MSHSPPPVGPRSAQMRILLYLPRPEAHGPDRVSRWSSHFLYPYCRLLRFVQEFVKQPRDVRHRRHGVLIIQPRRPNHRQRSHHFAAHPRWSPNEHKILHRRQGLVEPDHHPHRFLPRVKISPKQLYNFFLLLECPQHFLQPRAIFLASHVVRYQIRSTFHKHSLRVVAGSQRALLVELLDGLHQPVVVAALFFKSAGELGAHVAHGPATKILIDVARGQIKIRLLNIQPKHTVAHHPRARDHHRQHLLIAKARKVNMLQRIALSAGRHRDADTVRDQGEHMRSALHELLHVGNAGQSVLNDALILVRKTRLPTKLLDIITISLRRRHAPRRSMRLLQKSSIRQIRHHIANRSRTQPFAAGASKRPRPHRLSAGNERLDDGGQDFAFPSARWPCWHIDIYPSPGAELPL